MCYTKNRIPAQWSPTSPLGGRRIIQPLLPSPPNYPDLQNVMIEVAADGFTTVRYLDQQRSGVGGEEEGRSKWYEPGFSEPVTGQWYGNEVQANLQTNYGSGSEFISGFIKECKDQATADSEPANEYLPDVLSIHGYMGKYEPENRKSNTTDNPYQTVTEWPNRISELQILCASQDYYPYFAVTEYGFSPTETTDDCPAYTNDFFPVNGDEISQAVYYLRSSLMNATVKDASGNGWFLCTRFSHNKGVSCNSGSSKFEDFGWHNDDTLGSDLGSHRAVKPLMRYFFTNDNNDTEELNHPNTNWNNAAFQPFFRNVPYDPINGIDGVAWCAWLRASGWRRGAIWTYKWGEDYVQDTTPSTEDFVIAGDWRNYELEIYRATITSSTNIAPYNASVSVNLATRYIQPYTYISGETTFQIPGVTHIPSIIRINPK